MTTTTSSSTTSNLSRAEIAERLTGLPIGPYPVGVTTIQIDGRRGLQTEIWYPADETARESPPTKYSDYLGIDKADDPEAALAAANAPTAIGGYREGISIAELDDPDKSTWLTTAVRNASCNNSKQQNAKFPLVVFSHGSGAYRASYGFWTEFLASHGYVVAACDHPGSARYTIVDGKVITPGGPRSKRAQMEVDRPLDVIQIIDGLAALGKSSESDNASESGSDSDTLGGLFGAIDTDNVALTGMSFGGYTTAAALEQKDPRVRAAVMMCASMSMSGTKDYHTPSRTNKETPVMVMIGTEDTVLGFDHNDSNRQYVANHASGDAYLLELVRGGHVSFTSCELYDPEYGNGINDSGRSNSLTQPGETYAPWDIRKQHGAINHYGLRFLNRYLKNDVSVDPELRTSTNPFDPAEVLFRSNLGGGSE
eukprot:jgi/Psemu1/297101/fgenesh1_pm.239_\